MNIVKRVVNWFKSLTRTMPDYACGVTMVTSDAELDRLADKLEREVGGCLEIIPNAKCTFPFNNEYSNGVAAVVGAVWARTACSTDNKDKEISLKLRESNVDSVVHFLDSLFAVTKVVEEETGIRTISDGFLVSSSEKFITQLRDLIKSLGADCEVECDGDCHILHLPNPEPNGEELAPVEVDRPMLVFHSVGVGDGGPMYRSK